jgi:hypothetical protein
MSVDREFLSGQNNSACGYRESDYNYLCLVNSSYEVLIVLRPQKVKECKSHKMPFGYSGQSIT